MLFCVCLVFVLLVVCRVSVCLYVSMLLCCCCCFFGGGWGWGLFVCFSCMSNIQGKEHHLSDFYQKYVSHWLVSVSFKLDMMLCKLYFDTSLNDLDITGFVESWKLCNCSVVKWYRVA